MIENLGSRGVTPGESWPIPKLSRRAESLIAVLGILNESEFIKALTEESSDIFDQNSSMITASKTLDEFAKVNESIYRNTELHIGGVDLGLNTQSSSALKRYGNAESQDQQSVGDSLTFYIPAEDSLICLFHSFFIKPALPTSPEEHIYTVNMRVINVYIIPDDPRLTKILIPGYSTIEFPIPLECLEIIVAEY